MAPKYPCRHPSLIDISSHIITTHNGVSLPGILSNFLAISGTWNSNLSKVIEAKLGTWKLMLGKKANVRCWLKQGLIESFQQP